MNGLTPQTQQNVNMRSKKAPNFELNHRSRNGNVINQISLDLGLVNSNFDTQYDFNKVSLQQMKDPMNRTMLNIKSGKMSSHRVGKRTNYAQHREENDKSISTEKQDQTLLSLQAVNPDVDITPIIESI